MAAVTPTPTESLYLWRRRKNLTQIEAAQAIGVHVDRYREWEAGRGEPIPRRHLGELKAREACLLLRRRKNWTQRHLAKLMGVTRLWVIQMENGTAPVDRLKHYWNV